MRRFCRERHRHSRCNVALWNAEGQLNADLPGHDWCARLCMRGQILAAVLPALPLFAENGIAPTTNHATAEDVALRSMRLNFVLRVAPGIEDFGSRPLEAELACHYRVPHVRLVVRIRVMCQAGRALAAGGREDTIAWLCERAPLWVVVHVCALLRCVPSKAE
jgi:hypothetical protein